MRPIEIIIISLSVFCVVFLVFEVFYIRYLRKRIKKIIHINGTRGKSTVTRMIGTVLRNNGYNVLTKVTGTKPVIINNHGQERVIKRLGNPNIKEQITIMKHAYRQKADVLVIECMAVNPEYQRITQDVILKADISVITNARLDHTDVMGKNTIQIANSLSNTIPKDGILIIPKSLYELYSLKAMLYNTEIKIVEKINESASFEHFNENFATVVTVCKEFGISEDQCMKSLKDFKQDSGALTIIKREKTTFINGFAINDPMSIEVVYERIKEKYPNEDITILINNRSDRPTRALQHIDLLNKLNPKKVYVIGAFKTIFKRRVRGEVESCKRVGDISDKLVFGIGNIKGAGQKAVDYYLHTEESNG